MLRVYAITPRWFLRPYNTDWVYTRSMLPRLSEFVRECQVHPADSIRTTLRSNLTYVCEHLKTRLRLPASPSFQTMMDRHDFTRSRCDVAFTHAGFPVNASGIPVVWQNSILDPAMALAWGRSHSSLDREREAKRKGFAEAVCVMVTTQAERKRLSGWFPELAARFVTTPFFLPHIHAISPSDLERKLSRQSGLRCLFVGHAAYRKGLDRVLEAYGAMSAPLQKRIQLAVISQRNDASIRIPRLPGLTYLPELDRQAILQWMRDSDVFLMPSRFESYGITYLEAMSQGTIPIVPNWEVQREIVDYGRAGVVTSGEPSEIVSSLKKILDDRDNRQRLARAAHRRFQLFYSPPTVATQLCSVFRHAADRWHPARFLESPTTARSTCSM